MGRAATSAGLHQAGWEGPPSAPGELPGAVLGPGRTRQRRGDVHKVGRFGRLRLFEPLTGQLTNAGIDHEPTDDEIRRALGKLHNTAPGDSGLPAAVWKALAATDESFALVRQIVLTFWPS